MRTKTLMPLVALLATASLATSQQQLQGDPVWPPAAPDPQTLSQNPEQGSKLFMHEISFTIVDEFGSPNSEIAQWFDHNNGNSWGGQIALGDLSGKDDGELHIAIVNGHKAVMAGRIDINFAAKTGTITPIFIHLSDKVVDDAGSTTPIMADPNIGGSGRNLLINDFDGDGKNELAVQLAENHSSGVRRYLTLLQENPNAGTSSYGYSTPQPVELARSSPALSSDDFDIFIRGRMGTCKLRDAGHMIVMHDHDTKIDFGIWSYDGVKLEMKYESSLGNHTTFSTGNKTHEFNYVDVDDDGFDEFFVNGVIDFVDRGPSGDYVDTNDRHGVARWVTGMDSGHMDQLMVADWDPDREGLEMIGLPEGNFTAPSGATYTGSHAIMYDAKEGHVLGYNDGVNPPGEAGTSPDCQVVIGGNFTAQGIYTPQGAPGTPSALEAMFIPKNLGQNADSVTPPGEMLQDPTGNYVIDYQMNELAMDGINFVKGNVNPYYPPPAPAPGIFVTGPGRKEIWSMDWDGDRSEDEIYCRVPRLLTVFRMGLKGDWGGPDVPGWMPKRSDLLDQNDDVIPFQFDNDPLQLNYFLHYYQGSPPAWAGTGQAQPDWAWNHGGPGRYTHYYEKLAHVWPHHGQFSALPYDIAGDQREELIVANKNGIFLYANDDALNGPVRPSPHFFEEYRRWRQEPVSFPFEWLSLPTLDELEVRPEDAALPSRVVGMHKNFATLQLKAIAHYSDGREVDVTGAVTWIPDEHTDAHLTLSATGLLTSQNKTVSARVQAELAGVKSNTLYVQATADSEPVILLAGYQETYLDQGNPDQKLRVTAYVAQKNNDPDLLVTMVTPGSSANPLQIEEYWQPHGQTIWLVDDGMTGTSGDELAGDGIYTALIDPGPQVGDGLSLGDNLKFVQAARWDPNTTFLGLLNFSGSPNFEKGNTWPSVVIGPTGPVITEPAPSPPTVIDDNLAFWGPGIAACGTRGYGIRDGKVMIEAIIRPALLVTDPLTVRVYVPWLGAYVALTESAHAEDVFTALVDTAGAANGAYLLDVQATVHYSGVPPYTQWPSDWGGRLYLHDAIPD